MRSLNVWTLLKFESSKQLEIFKFRILCEKRIRSPVETVSCVFYLYFSSVLETLKDSKRVDEKSLPSFEAMKCIKISLTNFKIVEKVEKF